MTYITALFGSYYFCPVGSRVHPFALCRLFLFGREVTCECHCDAFAASSFALRSGILVLNWGIPRLVSHLHPSIHPSAVALFWRGSCQLAFLPFTRLVYFRLCVRSWVILPFGSGVFILPFLSPVMTTFWNFVEDVTLNGAYSDAVVSSQGSLHRGGL